MGKIKELLEEEFYKDIQRPWLHWMSEEYFYTINKDERKD